MNELIQLHLISPAYVDPTPDTTSGRFGTVLRSVGATTSVYVRPRMITAVAGTKYKTRSGLPVTLVGLHGKDELLVVGPDWAILKLASGDVPKTKPAPDSASVFDEAIQFVLEEMFWLQKLEVLLSIAQSDQEQNSKFSDPVAPELIFGELSDLEEKSIWKNMNESVHRYIHEPVLDKLIAEEMLQGMLSRVPTQCLKLFRTVNAREYAKSMLVDCLEKYAEFQDQANRIYDVHPIWWSEWSKENQVALEIRLPNYLMPSGRNISKYHFAELTEPDAAKPRRYSMHQRWSALLQKHCAKTNATTNVQSEPAEVG